MCLGISMILIHFGTSMFGSLGCSHKLSSRSNLYLDFQIKRHEFVLNQWLRFISGLRHLGASDVSAAFSLGAFSSKVKDHAPCILPDQRSWFTSGLQRSGNPNIPTIHFPIVLSSRVKDRAPCVLLV
jgi:hypothetical protein